MREHNGPSSSGDVIASVTVVSKKFVKA